MAADPATILFTVNEVSGMIKELFEKFPEYKEKVQKDFNKTELKYKAYIKRPKATRHPSYLNNLRTEYKSHLLKAPRYMS